MAAPDPGIGTLAGNEMTMSETSPPESRQGIRDQVDGRLHGSGSGLDAVASTEDLSITFARGRQRIHALQGVSIAVQPGEIVALVGESGSGKSALGLCLLGLLPTRPAPEVAGTATICGVDMLTSPESEKRAIRRSRLGAVFQDPMTSLNPTMRVGAQVIEAAGSEDEALSLLEAAGIPHARTRMRSYPHELSGGLRQRVMIAMALAGEPSLVIADEPTTALDVTVQAQILELIRELRETKRTSFLFVTHDLAVAQQVADRVVVMYGGRVAESGPAGAVFDSPYHPYSAGLLDTRITLDGPLAVELPTLAGDPVDNSVVFSSCPYLPRCPSAQARCEDGVPELRQLDADRWVACPISADEYSGPGLVSIRSKARRAFQPAPRTLDLTESPDSPEIQLRGEASDGKASSHQVVVTVNDAEKSFPLGRRDSGRAVLALRGASLRVMAGESVAIVGESGSGKTTLLRAISGLTPLDSGSVQIEGRSPQMVFQDAGSSLTPWMTVGDILGERLRKERMSRHARRARVIEALRSVELSAGVVDAKPHQLSGGQRQRLAIARAVMVPPSVLLCDEPTSALDVSMASTVVNLLGRLRSDLGIAMVFVTHDLAVARTVADRLCVMYLGRVVEEGPADLVCSNPGHPYSIALLESVPGRGRFSPVSGEPPNPVNPPAGCSFHPRCPQAEAACSATSPCLKTGQGEEMSGLHPGDHHLVACIHWGGRLGSS